MAYTEHDDPDHDVRDCVYCQECIADSKRQMRLFIVLLVVLSILAIVYLPN